MGRIHSLWDREGTVVVQDATAVWDEIATKELMIKGNKRRNIMKK